MITKSQFRPLWWLRNPHLQTLWPVLTNKKSHPGRDERLTLSDGDFLDLVWFDVDEDADAPLVIILHGLEGSIHSPYAVAITKALQQHRYQTLFMHFRGCSGTPNLKDRSYHSGETGDLSEVIAHAKKVTGKPIYAAIGYSLGGNALLKWLGEKGLQHTQGDICLDIERAVTVSVPYVLSDAAQRMTMGASRIYENYLLSKLRKSFKRKFHFDRLSVNDFDRLSVNGRTSASPLNVDVDELKDFASFDDQVTAPLHGFSSGKEYYRLSSSRQYLKEITTQTLLIHSKDDPFMYESTIPTEKELSNSVTLELAEKGGHVGFIGGKLLPQRWLEGRILEFLT